MVAPTVLDKILNIAGRRIINRGCGGSKPATAACGVLARSPRGRTKALPYRVAGIGNACGDLLRREDNILPYGVDLCPS